MKMKFFISITISIITLMTLLNTINNHKYVYPNKSNNTKLTNNKVHKQVTLSSFNKSNTLTFNNKLKDLITKTSKSSFLELEEKEQLAAKLGSSSMLENKLRSMASLQLKNHVKKRYTIDGRSCAEQFVFEGKSYDDCTLGKSPDGMDKREEWCYVNPDQKAKDLPDWNYCQPDLDYDKVRKRNQQYMDELTQMLRLLIEKINQLQSFFMGLVNFMVNIIKSMLNLDPQINNLLQDCSRVEQNLDNLSNAEQQWVALENDASAIGAGIDRREKMSQLSSFLEANLKLGSRDVNAISASLPVGASFGGGNMSFGASASAESSRMYENYSMGGSLMGGSMGSSSSGSSSGSSFSSSSSSSSQGRAAGGSAVIAGSQSHGFSTSGPFSKGHSQYIQGSGGFTGGGNMGGGVNFSVTPQSSGKTWDVMEDSDEIIGKEEEQTKAKIAKWMQERRQEKTKNCEGMLHYEEESQGDGLYGKYFDNQQFVGSFTEQKDREVDFDFTGTSPAAGINRKNFSIKWTGTILAPHTGKFKFYLDADDGISLTVNNKIIISHNMQTPNQDIKSRTERWIKGLIRKNQSNSNQPNKTSSKPIELIGGNKYRIVLSYFHSSHDQIDEDAKVYIKMTWSSDNFPEEKVNQKYLYSDNVYPPTKITGMSLEEGTTRKFLENDLAFKNSRNYVQSDIPKEYIGLPAIKLDTKFMKEELAFELNNPSFVYIAWIDGYPDPSPADFEDTGDRMTLHYIKTPKKKDMNNTIFKAEKTTLLKIHKKAYDAGIVRIPLNRNGINKKGIPMVVFIGYDQSNSAPVSCGGKPLWISQPTSQHFKKCTASSEYPDGNWKCEAGLTGHMRDQSGSMWASKNEGEGAWMELSFTNTFQVSKVEFQDRRNGAERNELIEMQFSNGITKNLEHINSDNRREYIIDPPIKSHTVKFTIKKVYGTINNGGAFKVFGYPCKSAEDNNDSPEMVGMANITGISPNSLPPLFDFAKTTPVDLVCKESLSNSKKFNGKKISSGSVQIIKCKKPCGREPLKVYGGENRYSVDSPVCKAAFHSGKLPFTGGLIKMIIGESGFSLRSEYKSGMKTHPKMFTRNVVSFEPYKEKELIIMQPGSKVDIKDPYNQGWLPGVIRKIIHDPDKGKQLEVSIEGENSEQEPMQIAYPDKARMDACGEYVKDRDCDSSRTEINKKKPVKVRFVTEEFKDHGEYLRDQGGLFGSSGKPYGWSRDMSSRVRNRDSNKTEMKTLVEFPPDKKSTFCKKESTGVNCEPATWSMKVGPGKFQVIAGVGDPAASTRLDLKANGKYLTRGKTLKKNEYEEFEAEVMASNEFITILSECSENCDYQMSKLNFLKITPVMDDQTFAKTLAQPKTPERKTKCGKARKGGECETGPNVENCLFDRVDHFAAKHCTGLLLMVPVPSDYKCQDQRGKFKCVKKDHGNDDAKCALYCPAKCKKGKCT